METVCYQGGNQVGIIRLNRPKVMNAINEEMILDLVSALKAAQDEKTVRVIILKGEGKAFSAGADLKTSVKTRTLDEHREFAKLIQSIPRTFASLFKPTIAAVHGYALGGGCGLAISCDIRIAAEGTKFGFPELKIGGTIAQAATFMLPRLIGMAKAKEMFFTGEMIDAIEAERIGLVNKVVPIQKLDNEAMQLARKIAGNFPLSVQLAKTCVDGGLESSLNTVLQAELDAHCIAFVSGSRAVGMAKAIKKNEM
ncbi:MAG: enoyl-CoA hydratase/isomerase family protein [Alphaproteobacteria bacterium]